MSAAPLETFGPLALPCLECHAGPGEPCRAGCAGDLWPTGDGAGAIHVTRDGLPHWQPAGAPCVTCGGLHGPTVLAVV